MPNRIVHFDIGADDPEALAEFYKKTFGWTVTKWEGGEMPYWLVETGPKDEPGINGGIYKRRWEVPKGEETNTFVCSIAVEDVDKASEEIVKNGGTVDPKMEIPKVGWTVMAKDPQGNAFSTIQMLPDAMDM